MNYLDKAQPDMAIPALFFAKAYELRHGDTDGMLATAYLANGEPCLALGDRLAGAQVTLCR
jgi:hypothetical protein